jgi:hypothetical protein
MARADDAAARKGNSARRYYKRQIGPEELSLTHLVKPVPFSLIAAEALPPVESLPFSPAASRLFP